MKDELCKAFCGDLRVRDVPDGLAVSTGFERQDGDAIGFYIVRDEAVSALFRIEDDGTTIPFIEACGVDFSTDTRAAALSDLLKEYEAEYNDEDSVIHSRSMPEGDLPQAAMKFVALLLRMSDFILLSQDRVASTFKEDTAAQIKQRLLERAEIVENEPVSRNLQEITPDMVIRAKDRAPVALFFGTTAQRVNDAIFLHMTALHEAHENLAVVALLETQSVISRDLLKRAMNRLSAVTSFRGDEDAAIRRIEQEAIGRLATLH